MVRGMTQLIVSCTLSMLMTACNSPRYFEGYKTALSVQQAIAAPTSHSEPACGPAASPLYRPAPYGIGESKLDPCQYRTSQPCLFYRQPDPVLSD